MRVAPERADSFLNNATTSTRKNSELNAIVSELADRHDCSNVVIVAAALWHFAGLDEDEVRWEVEQASVPKRDTLK